MSDRQHRKRQEGKARTLGSARQFVESREHACPFAVEAEHRREVEYVVVSELKPEIPIRNAMREFVVGSKKALVLIFPESTHRLPLQAVMKKAIDYFTEAGTALIEMYNPGASRTATKAKADEEFRAHLENPDSDIIPHLGHPSRGAMYTIFMGQYERPHPRWAPHPMLVMTWISDVEAAQADKPRVVEVIRDRVFREFGAPYDAKAVILPHRPEEME